MEDAAFADIRFVHDAPREYFGHLKECNLAQRNVVQLDAGLFYHVRHAGGVGHAAGRDGYLDCRQIRYSTVGASFRRSNV